MQAQRVIRVPKKVTGRERGRGRGFQRKNEMCRLRGQEARLEESISQTQRPPSEKTCFFPMRALFSFCSLASISLRIPWATPVQEFVAKDAVWLFVRDPESLSQQDRTVLTAICQVSNTASNLYKLTQEFRTRLHQRTGDQLDDWLTAVKKSQIRELQSFVTGIERDKAAVIAGLTLPYHNGLVEGRVNKLKLIKRMGYGRANFALLRQCVLHAL